MLKQLYGKKESFEVNQLSAKLQDVHLGTSAHIQQIFMGILQTRKIFLASVYCCLKQFSFAYYSAFMGFCDFEMKKPNWPNTTTIVKRPKSGYYLTNHRICEHASFIPSPLYPLYTSPFIPLVDRANVSSTRWVSTTSPVFFLCKT